MRLQNVISIFLNKFGYMYGGLKFVRKTHNQIVSNKILFAVLLLVAFFQYQSIVQINACIG